MTGKHRVQTQSALSAVPNIARLQRIILSSATQIGAREASRLLGLSAVDPDDALTRMWNRGEILGFEVDGQPLFPLFQFDAVSHRVLPGLSTVMIARPPGWSDYRLLHWLTTPHVDLGCTPAEAISSQGNAVLAAFKKKIETPHHG